MITFQQAIKGVKNVLLVEPCFPVPAKSRNHSNFLPLGLLKIAGYLREKKYNVCLQRFPEKIVFNPDIIFVTSLFTYWSKYVREVVTYYKKEYPSVPVIVGGIYASLLPEHCKKYTECDEVITGIIPEVETVKPAYDLVDVDYQILHTTRGCIRKCGFCGVYIVEPEWMYKKSIKEEICKKKLVFYDNNLLANPYIEGILDELVQLKKEKKISYVESQSGFDGRLLINNPRYAVKMKEAGFKNPKIAWDHSINDAPQIKKQLDVLIHAGYKAKEISVFMIYNFDIDYNEMEDKRVKCFEWGVQITDCRFRPLNSVHDGYNPRKKRQTRNEYHIHEGWADYEVRMFRKNVRRHNICIRSNADFYSTLIERKSLPRAKIKELKNMSYEEAKHFLDVWTPKHPHYIKRMTNLITF